jgi:simple sugar transport system ATP-binding protein
VRFEDEGDKKLRKRVLCIKNVSKEYNGSKVLKDVSLSVLSGEIHAIVGENGAGKSTLMNILFGMSVIRTTGGFDGSIEIDGRQISIKSPSDAMREGIGMVHQEFMLIPGYTITENVKLNREITKENSMSRLFPRTLQSLDMAAMYADTRRALDKLDIGIEEYATAGGLPVGYKQFVEIAREIDKSGLKILVFDEPTAVLAESEAKNLLDAIISLARNGIAVILIDHRLNEVMDVADRISILKDGSLVSTKNKTDTNAAEIAQLMIGRDVVIERLQEGKHRGSSESILKMEDFCVEMPGERVKGVTLDIKRGEIVGIGGLAGQGKLGIANGILGLYPSSGNVWFKGSRLPPNDPESSLKLGIGFVSEDRKGIGLLLDESIEMNMALGGMQINNDFLYSFGFVKFKNARAVRANAEKMVHDLDIRCASTLQHTKALSGGNQQKVCLARALTQKPELLLISEQTRGLDIGAKKLILDMLLKLNREQGMTIVMTSSELAELKSICDRIVIVCEGKIAGVLPPNAPDADFGLMMSGFDHEIFSNEAI